MPYYNPDDDQYPPRIPPPGAQGPTPIGTSVQAAPPAQTAPTGMAVPPQQRPAMIAAPIGQPSAQTQTDQKTLADRQAQGSGISRFQQNHHIIGPILRALDIAGSVATPGLAAQIPGTSLNYQMAIGQQRRRVAGDIANDQQQAKTAEDAAAAQKDLNPPDQDKNDWRTIVTPQGTMGWNPIDKKYNVPMGPPAPKEDKKLPLEKIENTDGVYFYDPNTKETTQASFNGQPLKGKNEKPPAETGAVDDQKYEGILAKKALRAPTTPEENAFQTAYEKRKGLGAATNNFYAEGREEKKEEHDDAKAATKADTATRQASYKAYQPSLDSAERFNVMSKNYEDAVKNHDQQAMLSLLANHLGMTMGLQKGARMTRDIVQEAQQSRPWLQGLQAKFDKDGYLSGVNLTPEQMRQMVDLGRERFSEDLGKSRSEAKYLGAKDDGPDRKANPSTIRYYIGLANGDHVKAKALAAQDGWTL